MGGKGTKRSKGRMRVRNHIVRERRATNGVTKHGDQQGSQLGRHRHDASDEGEDAAQAPAWPGAGEDAGADRAPQLNPRRSAPPGQGVDAGAPCDSARRQRRDARSGPRVPAARGALGTAADRGHGVSAAPPGPEVPRWSAPKTNGHTPTLVTPSAGQRVWGVGIGLERRPVRAENL